MSDDLASFELSSSRAFSDQKANAAEVVPNDDTDIAPLPEALFVGGGGTLVVEMLGGQVVPFEVMDCATMPILVRKVLATGTTATNIVALWG